jgi:hypothetical protein
MRNMRVEAHVHDIPDNGVVETHGEGRVVGVYVAVDLVPLTLNDLTLEKRKGAYREEIRRHTSINIRQRRVDFLRVPKRLVATPSSDGGVCVTFIFNTPTCPHGR